MCRPRVGAERLHLALQRLNRFGQRHVIARHGPTQVGFDGGAFAPLPSPQCFGRDGQFQEWVVAFQQDQGGRHPPRRPEYHVPVTAALKDLHAVFFAGPLPEHFSALHEPHAVQAQEPWPVGRIESQPVRAGDVVLTMGAGSIGHLAPELAVPPGVIAIGKGAQSATGTWRPLPAGGQG